MEFTKEQSDKINLIAILEDLQHQYMMELQPDLRFGMKKMINKAEFYTRQFIKECDKVFNKQSQDDFGSTSDDIRIIIERELL